MFLGASRADWRSDVFFADESSNERRVDNSGDSFDEVLITPPTDQCHCSSIAPLPDGKLFVVWYGGTREGAKDARIYAATVDKSGTASDVRPILDASTLGRHTNRYVRKLGNPVVYRQGSRLWLFVVSVSLGGWSGSSLNYAYSDDCGESWSTFRHLRTNPSFNMGTLVRCPVVPLQDGGFVLPAYCEFLGKFGVGVRFDSDGRMVDRVKIPVEGNRAAIQPCCVPLGARRALAFLRTPGRKIGVGETLDAGLSWQARPDLPLDNPDSSVAAFKTIRNQLAIAGNPKEGRGRLVVWINDSSDDKLWKEIAVLEDSDGDEFSYPFICESDGNVYVSYTYKRRGVKIVNLTKKLDSTEARVDGLKDRTN